MIIPGDARHYRAISVTMWWNLIGDDLTGCAQFMCTILFVRGSRWVRIRIHLGSYAAVLLDISRMPIIFAASFPPAQRAWRGVSLALERRGFKNFHVDHASVWSFVAQPVTGFVSDNSSAEGGLSGKNLDAEIAASVA